MIDIFPIKKGDTFLVGNGVKSFELTGKLTILVSYCQTK